MKSLQLKNILPLFVCICGLSGALQAQSIVVSEYEDTFTELLVITDNLDIRNFTVRDNTRNHNTWKGLVTFNNISLWQNLRAGTIIIIDHSGSAATDVDKTDGYIQIGVSNTTYFTYNGTPFGTENQGDIFQIRDGSGTHVHALGHNNTAAGTDWTTLPAPKVYFGGPSANKNIRATGASLADYNGTSADKDNVTKGLANISAASQNQTYWRSVRQPDWTAPSLNLTATANNVILTWNPFVTDSYPSDGVTGYIVLRNLVNSFTDPVDGIIYAAGSTLGTATVIANIDNSQTGTYTDATAPCNTYYYRVYAYRYGADNSGNTSSERGRAYNEAAFASGTVNTPLVVSAGTDGTICQGESYTLGGAPSANGGTTPYTYSWTSIPAGFTSSDSNPVVTPSDTITYILNVIDNNGCSGTDTIGVIVNPLPAAYTGPDRTVCGGDIFQIGATAVSGNTYIWSPEEGLNDANIADPIVTTPVNVSEYILTYTLTEFVTATGCFESNTVTITVKPNPSTTNINAN